MENTAATRAEAVYEGEKSVNFTRIRYFVEAAKWGNFTSAAAHLYTTQPNLSKQIGILEQELGFPLFTRVNRAVRLTPAGEYLYAHWQHIPEELERDIEHARNLSRAFGGKLVVGVLENILMAERFRFLQEAAPGLEFELERDTFSGLTQGLADGRYDVIVTLDFEVNGVGGLCAEVLQRGQTGAIFLSKSRPKADLPDLRLEDLRDEPFVAISPKVSPGGYDLLLRQCAQAGFAPNVVRTPTTLDTLLLCVEAGEGCVILDRTTRLEYSAAVRIVPLMDGQTIDVVAAWPENNYNPAIRRLVSGLRDV